MVEIFRPAYHRQLNCVCRSHFDATVSLNNIYRWEGVHIACRFEVGWKPRRGWRLFASEALSALVDAMLALPHGDQEKHITADLTIDETTDSSV